MGKLNLFHRDRLSGPVGHGVVAGLMELAYIALVAIFMVGTQPLMANQPDSASWSMVFGFLAFLSLFVFSAAVSGIIVLGYPFYYFTERKYKEALYAFLGTLVTMFVVFAIIFLVVLLVPYAA
jgi:hypothetical protein